MKTLLNILHLSTLLLVLQTRSGSAGDIPTGTPARVGDRGDPARLSIEGAQTFTEGDIRRALQSDLDYLVAAHPEATLSECLAAVEQRVGVGYRGCGFPDVAVQARFDLPADRIAVKVTEGSRFRCGALQVTGLKSIRVADFNRRFAEKLAPASDQATPYPALWKAGMPASFTAESQASCSAAASNTFAALGRFAAKFKVGIQPQPDGSNATLNVIVADEGPAAVLREIEVVGTQKNRRADVIGFLGLRKGMKLTQDLIDEKTRALTQAARFVDASIMPTVLGAGGQVSLRVAVVENDHLPSLQQPLSREEKTLLRLRDWLMSWESRQDDLVVDWSAPTAPPKGPFTYIPGQGWSASTARPQPLRIEVILAPAGGIVARVSGNATGQEKLPDRYSLVLKPAALTLSAHVDQRKLRIPLPPGWSGAAFVKLVPSANSPSGFGLSLGVGLSPGQTNTGLQLRVDLLPAALTDLLYRKETKATWQSNVLTVRTENFVFRVDEGTGRLLEAEAIRGKPTSGAGDSDAYRVTVRFTVGAFAKAQDQIAASTSAYSDAYRSQRAAGSALGFIAAELALAKPLWSSAAGSPPPEPQTALASALEKLLAGSLLDPLQTLLDGAAAARSDDAFTIPSKSMKNQGGAREEFERVAVWGAGHAQELAPADSWLQILLRESAFTLNSRTEHTSAAITRLAAADDLGPIGCFVGLHALLGSNQDSWASFRDLGLRRMSTESFRRDYLMLLKPGSVITESLANLVRELGTLTPAEVEAIAGLLPADGAALAREMAAATSKAKDLPMPDAIGPVLDRWWETTAREKVEAGFRSHAHQTGPAKSGHQPDAVSGRAYFPAGIVAVVNDRLILDSEIRERMSPTVESLRRQHTNNPALFAQKLQEQQQQVLESLINDELVLTEAIAAGRKISDVIETREAWFVMRVADRRPAAVKPLAEVREDIAKTLLAQDRSAVMKHWRDDLRADAFVRYFSSVAVDSVSPESRVVTIEIKHIGVATVSDALIRSHLCVKAGEPVTQASVDHDIRSLYGTGDFYNIRVSEAAVDGGIKLSYFVQEKPVLTDIQFAGNKNISSQELLPKLTSKSGQRLDERRLFSDSQAIQRRYERAGYPQATVKYVPSINEQTARGSVTFQITEGP